MSAAKRFHALAVAMVCFVLSGCGGAPPPEEEGPPPTPVEHAAGQAVYESNCASCHDSSRDGSPRLGYLPAWERRLAQGEEALLRHAIEGIDLMPPRGDNPELTDDQVASAVGYMIYRAKLNIPAGH